MNKFSIIVPVYNAEKTIERLLASFISNKDYIREVILVNDRSDDDTFSKIEIFKNFFDIRVINNQGNRGPGPARKTGILAAQGEWITFVDADDCLTPSSLYYINKEINEQKDIVLLHTQSIFYESGSFNLEHIDYSDGSCGGNFYKRNYLIQNNILPHDELLMAEDEYFNDILIKYIELYENENIIGRYEYPVYEVHHDTDEEISFAIKNWGDYLCKYHLLGKMYFTDFFKHDKNILNELKNDLLDNFIFCFYLAQGLIDDPEVDFRINALKYFNQVLQYIKNIFNITEEDIIEYFNSNSNHINNLYEWACESTGIKIRKMFPFENFVKYLHKYAN